MPLDPSISLQVQPPRLMTPADAISLRNLAMQNQMGQIQLANALREQQAQEQLRQAFANAQGEVDPTTGLPKGVTLSDIYKIDPKTGMAVQKNILETQVKRATLGKERRLEEKARFDINEKKLTVAKDADSAALIAYEQAISKGIPEPQARLLGQQEYMKQYERLSGSGLFSEDEVKRFPMTFDPQQSKASILKYQDYVKQQQPESSLGKLERDYRMGAIDRATYEAGKRKATTIQPTMASVYLSTMGGQGTTAIGGKGPANPFMLSDQATEMAADRYNKFGELPPTGFGVAGQIQKAKILNRAAEKLKEEGKSGEAAAIDQKVNKSIGTAISAVERNRGMILTFEKTARKNAEILRETAAKVDDTGSPVINRWIRAGRKSIAGDADVAKFDLALRTFINEYARVTNSATGGGVTSDTARKEIEGTLSTAMTVDQINGVIDTAIREMQNREISYNEQLQDMRNRMRSGAVSSEPTSVQAPSGAWNADKERRYQELLRKRNAAQ